MYIPINIDTDTIFSFWKWENIDTDNSSIDKYGVVKLKIKPDTENYKSLEPLIALVTAESEFAVMKHGQRERVERNRGKQIISSEDDEYYIIFESAWQSYGMGVMHDGEMYDRDGGFVRSLIRNATGETKQQYINTYNAFYDEMCKWICTKVRDTYMSQVEAGAKFVCDACEWESYTLVYEVNGERKILCFDSWRKIL